MAFTTQFVMGAGGAEVEEIPVSMSGTGNGTVHSLTTVDAGAGAIVVVAGTLASSSTTKPDLHIGSSVYASPVTHLTGPQFGVVDKFTGSIAVSIRTRSGVGTTTFNGTVYVVRM